MRSSRNVYVSTRGFAVALFGLFAALILLFAGVPLSAQETKEEASTSEPTSSSSTSAARSPGEVSTIVDEVSQEMYSPYCEHKSLAMCPSGGAAEVRRYIQREARKGTPVDEIKEQVRTRYRDEYLDLYGEDFEWEEPPAKDNYPLIALVVAGLLVCILAVWLFARSRSGESSDSEDASDTDWSDEDEIYLDEIRSQYQD